MSPEEGVGTGPRGSIALLIDPVFGRYLFGRLFSAGGIWVQNIAAVILMWRLTGSAFLVGAVSVAQFFGPLVLAPWTGAMTDVLDRRRMLMAGRLLSCIAATVLTGVTAFAEPTVPLLLGATLVLGLGLAVSAPAMQAVVPSLVPSRDLGQAIALASMTNNLARALGPAVGSAIVLAGGPAAAFGAAAVSHAVFALLLVGLTGPLVAEGGNRGVLEGFRYLGRDRPMALLIVGVAALGFGADPAITLTPALSDGMGGGEAGIGVLASAFGAGAMTTAFFVQTIRRWLGLRALGAIGFGIMTGGLLLSAATTLMPVGVTAFFLTGLGFLLGNTALMTRIQQRVPDYVRGRVLALWSVAFLGSRPFAAALNGYVADAWSARGAVVLVSVLTAATIGLALVRTGDAPGAPVENP